MRQQFWFVVLAFLFLCTTTLFSASASDKFFYAKKNYVTAVLHNNKSQEIKYLKQLVKYGQTLNKDVSKYKKELRRLDKNIKFSPTIKKQVKNNSARYSIKSVYTNGDAIIIEFNHTVSKRYLKYFERKSKKKYYDIFDLKGNFKDAAPTRLSMEGVDRIKVVQYRHKTLRISISHHYNLKTYYIFNGKKIIIKLKPKKEKKKLDKKQQITIKKRITELVPKKTIVIDAGHGGKDPGALGSKRIKEKYITLNIAKDLYKELKSKGFNVYLTRNRDKYISLRSRTRFANKKNADIFISIHANAAAKSRVRKAKGIETYFLSPARSKRAKRVAAHENKGDMDSMGYSSQNILLTLLNRSKIISSQKMAIDIQKYMLHSLRKYYGKRILDGGVREGPFWVLVGAQMPAVLIEVGYVTHPTESKRIVTRSYQNRIAKGIANGVISYFKKNP